jgi:hypothetical protein
MGLSSNAGAHHEAAPGTGGLSELPLLNEGFRGTFRFNPLGQISPRHLTVLIEATNARIGETPFRPRPEQMWRVRTSVSTGLGVTVEGNADLPIEAPWSQSAVPAQNPAPPLPECPEVVLEFVFPLVEPPLPELQAAAVMPKIATMAIGARRRGILRRTTGA